MHVCHGIAFLAGKIVNLNNVAETVNLSGRNRRYIGLNADVDVINQGKSLRKVLGFDLVDDLLTCGIVKPMVLIGYAIAVAASMIADANLAMRLGINITMNANVIACAKGCAAAAYRNK